MDPLLFKVISYTNHLMIWLHRVLWQILFFSELLFKSLSGQLQSSYFFVRSIFSEDALSEEIVSHVFSHFKTTISIYQLIVKSVNTQDFRP